MAEDLKPLQIKLKQPVTPVAIAGVRWLVFLRFFAKTKTAYGGQLATFVTYLIQKVYLLFLLQPLTHGHMIYMSIWLVLGH